MLNRLFTVLITIPIAVVLIALSVANRGSVQFSLDPFSADNPALTVSLPLFVLLFGALLVGLVVGGAATWLGQQRYRKAAKASSREAKQLRTRLETGDAKGGASPAGGLPALNS